MRIASPRIDGRRGGPRRSAALAVTTALALAGTLAIAPSAQGAGNWQPAATVSDPTMSSSDPVVAVAADGSVTAAWYQRVDEWQRVTTRTKVAGTPTWSPPTYLSVDGVHSYAPEIAVAPSGRVAISWVSRIDFLDVVHVATKAPGAGAWNTTRLTAPGADGFDYPPVLSVGTDGTFAVAWSETVKGRHLPHVAVRPPSATNWDIDTVAENATANVDHTVGVAPDGSVTAVWTQWDLAEAQYRLRSRTKAPGATSFGTPVWATPLGVSVSAPQIGYASDGTAVLIWLRSDMTTATLESAARKPGVEAWGAAARVSGDAVVEEPVLAVAPNGSAVASWVRRGTVRRIEVGHRAPNGTWGVPSFASGDGNAAEPSLAVNVRGTFVLGWNRAVEGGVEQVETVRRTAAAAQWSAVSVPSGKPKQINRNLLALAPDETTTVVWGESDGTALTIGTATTVLPRPSALTRPTVRGTAVTGATVTCVPGTWVNARTSTPPTWTRSGVAISGATKTGYRLTAADYGKAIACRHTASNATGSTLATSAAVTVKAGTIKSLVRPKITGKVKVGKKLKAGKGSWSVTPTSTKYQWFRGSSKIKGKAATKVTYKVVRKDKGKKLRVVVSVTAAGYVKASASSTTRKVR